MVSFMVHLLKLDHHSRIVIPAEYRKKLSLNEQTPLQISLIANQLVIRKHLPLTKEQIDDYKARKIAIQYGIQTVWTMLVFLQALKAQVVDEKTFDTLLATYTKVASPPISEYQIVLSMKKLLLSS